MRRARTSGRATVYLDAVSTSAPPAVRSTRHVRLTQKRTSAVQLGMYALGHKQTLLSLFDHLVGATLHRPGHGNAERLRGPEVDDQLHFRNLLYWQVCRIFTLENAAGVDARLPPSMREIRAIAH